MSGSDWDQSFGKGQVKVRSQSQSGEGEKIRFGWKSEVKDGFSSRS